MRDDRNKWPASPGLDRLPVRADHVTATLSEPMRQTVLSGQIGDCLALSGMKAAVGGEPDIAVGESYALRSRRDRIVVINGPQMQDGWHEDCHVAVSDMSAAFAVIDLSGPGADDVMATGTEFYRGLSSRSVNRLWHGFGLMAYRHGSVDTLRVHVRSAQLDAVWEMLERQITSLSRVWL